jgi:hypothetical protein
MPRCAVANRFAAIVALVPLMWCGACRAELEDEIQVYTDDINRPGEFHLELHVNTTPDGRNVPDYPGEVTPEHGTRITPEFSYGITSTLEAGLYIPTNIEPNGNWSIAGAKLRLKWLPVQPADHGGWFAGENLEWGDLEQRFSESRQVIELRTILGYRNDDWLVAFNPILDVDASPGFAHGDPDFNIGLKVSRKAAEGLLLGVEYYADFGPVKHFYSWSQQNHSIWLVMDLDRGPLPFQFGIGRGISPPADNWTVKAIFEVPL